MLKYIRNFRNRFLVLYTPRTLLVKFSVINSTITFTWKAIFFFSIIYVLNPNHYLKCFASKRSQCHLIHWCSAVLKSHIVFYPEVSIFGTTMRKFIFKCLYNNISNSTIRIIELL